MNKSDLKETINVYGNMVLLLLAVFALASLWVYGVKWAFRTGIILGGLAKMALHL